jgi:hypothetical protein
MKDLWRYDKLRSFVTDQCLSQKIEALKEYRTKKIEA